ncbi:MAG: MazG family protein [Clostridia bacterium]|nr:MazG family protein [Clostridia bacterium]
MHKITVVSLGPGSRAHITLGAMETLEKAKRLILRTGEVDAARFLQEKGIAFETLDALHEECEDFEQFASAAAGQVMKAAKRANVVYAVLDALADATVDELRKLCPESVTVTGGIPLSAPLLQAAGAKMPVRITSAMELTVPQTQDGLLIVELNSRMLAGECKLKLTPWYGDECEVYFFAPSEKPERSFVKIPLCEMDRQGKYNHTCALYIPPVRLTERERFDAHDLKRVMDILRGENGCPWDKEQTHESLARYLLEEAYEVSQAVQEEDWEHVADELGDVLLQVYFHAAIGEQYGTFELSDITTAICRKMIHRHRHIFGEEELETAGDVRDFWERMKQKERGNTTLAARLRDVSEGLPSLRRAEKILEKTGKLSVDPLVLLRDILGDTPEMRLLAAQEEIRKQGLCAEEKVHHALQKIIKCMENAEKEANLEGKLLENLTIEEIYVYCKRSAARL